MSKKHQVPAPTTTHADLEQPRLLRRREVAAILGICPGTVDTLRRRGLLEVVHITARAPRFAMSAVRGYVQARTGK